MPLYKHLNKHGQIVTNRIPTSSVQTFNRYGRQISGPVNIRNGPPKFITSSGNSNIPYVPPKYNNHVVKVPLYNKKTNKEKHNFLVSIIYDLPVGQKKYINEMRKNINKNTAMQMISNLEKKMRNSRGFLNKTFRKNTTPQFNNQSLKNNLQKRKNELLAIKKRNQDIEKEKQNYINQLQKKINAMAPLRIGWLLNTNEKRRLNAAKAMNGRNTTYNRKLNNYRYRGGGDI